MNKGDVDNIADAIRSHALTQEQRDTINAADVAYLRHKYQQIANYSDAQIIDAYRAWQEHVDADDEAVFLLFIDTDDD